MLPKFTCMVADPIDGLQRVHLVSDDGKDRADVFINAAMHLFQEDELPQNGKQYYIAIMPVESVVGE
jgi:hypothetical protein